jgi:transcriptional regulator with XRE-family HTH domain
MASAKVWLNQKFRDWEKTQGKAQSYYSFARYLGVSQTSLAAWMDGAIEPQADDLALIAAKLGPEIYAQVGAAQPHLQQDDRLAAVLQGLPAGLRERLTEAAVAAAQEIRDRGLAPDSIEGKRIAVETFASKGIRLTN